jgi:tRNA threonylcarbamoyladenosine modification (KEOPS) complex  Pcc1 subunit
MTKAANATARLRITLRSKKKANALADGLRPELKHPAGEKARAMISACGKSLILTFTANNSVALRAIMTSYLRLLAASVSVCDNLIRLERLPEEIG